MTDSASWVSLSEAAKLLGVHPATVRSWADRGLLQSQRTPGGHRRFRRDDLTQWMESQNSAPNAEAQLMVQSAMGRARLEMNELAEADWYRKLDAEARDQMRVQGRRLMEVLQRYLASPSDSALPEARDIGLRYGETIRKQGLKLAQAVEGFFTFNDFVVDATLQVSELSRPNTERNEAVRKVYAFTREIILALIDAYEE